MSDISSELPAYDPGTVPAWARESIACIGREHTENLRWHLDHVAEIEAAKRYMAEHPPSPPPASARDLLHLAAIEAWRAIASGKPVPAIDPAGLRTEIYEAFETGDGRNLVDQLYGTWLDLARQHGIPVADEHGDLLPGLDDAITATITAAVWFGITTGSLTLTGSYHIPRKFLHR